MVSCMEPPVPLVFLCLYWGMCACSMVVSKTLRCEHYNASSCSESKQGCFNVQECEQPEPEKRNHCFVLWQNSSTGEPVIQLKGCFLNNIDCYNKSKCVEKREEPTKALLFCCCEAICATATSPGEPVPTIAPPPASSECGSACYQKPVWVTP